MYFHSGKLHYESVTFGWRASGQKPPPPKKQMSTQQQTFSSASCDRPQSRCTPLFPGKRAPLTFCSVGNYLRRSKTADKRGEVTLRHGFGCTKVTWRPVPSQAAAVAGSFGGAAVLNHNYCSNNVGFYGKRGLILLVSCVSAEPRCHQSHFDGAKMWG